MSSIEHSTRPSVTTIDQAALHSFRANIRGTVLSPQDVGYDTARAAWNTNIDQHPALVVYVSGVADVLTSVAFARMHQLPIAVQSTGHGLAFPCDGALLVNTSWMKGIRVDPGARTVRVEAGALWHEVIHETQAFGLAPLSGFSPFIGVVGYTLGGGLGWLLRKYGLAADSVCSADVVTADGRFLHVSKALHSDLFWGLRGGSGNFGVATSLEVALYPVTSVYGGALFYPLETAKEVLTAYSQWVEQVPVELTSSIAIVRLPHNPHLPNLLQGKSVVVIRACYLGNEHDGATLLRPLQTVGEPLVSTFKQMPYRDTGIINSDPIEPQGSFGHTELLKELSATTIESLVAVAGARSHSPLLLVELRHLGGVMAQVPTNANAISHRDAAFLLHTEALLGNLEEAAAVKRYTQTIAEVLKPYTTGGVYLNFLGDGDVGISRTQAAYSPEHYRRLVELKDYYDPENLFRFNQNIPPSSVLKTLL